MSALAKHLAVSRDFYSDAKPPLCEKTGTGLALPRAAAAAAAAAPAAPAAAAGCFIMRSQRGAFKPASKALLSIDLPSPLLRERARARRREIPRPSDEH